MLKNRNKQMGANNSKVKKKEEGVERFRPIEVEEPKKERPPVCSSGSEVLGCNEDR